MGTTLARIQKDKEITFQARAKLNLTLEVLGKRLDGFHEIRSVIQTITLCDELRFRLSDRLEFKSNLTGWVGEQSLVYQAAAMLQKAAGSSRGAVIEVNKGIPLVSGLGGDSSDAAAVLSGLNKLWGLGFSQEELAKLAEQLGSDVPFFIYGGTALMEGRGERITPLPPLPHLFVVLAVPALSRLEGKTRRLYASLKPGHYTDGRITDRLVAALKEGQAITSSHLFNVFESVAFTLFPGLDDYRERMKEAGADNIHLAGSGPTLFTLVSDKLQAEELHIRLKQQGMEAYLAGFINSDLT